MYYIIYKITNNINKKEYIGAHQTTKVDDGYMGSGTLLNKAFKKYGKENFTKEVIQYCDSTEHMYSQEATLVNEQYVLNRNTYNLKTGGMGGTKASPQTIERMSKCKLGNKNAFYGKKHTTKSIEQNKQTQRDSYNNGYVNPFKGKTHTDGTKEHLSSIRKGTRLAEENSFYGKEHTEESKAKISKGWDNTREARIAGISKALSKQLLIYNNHDELVHTFESRQQFYAYCKEHGLPPPLIKCDKTTTYEPTPKRFYSYRGWYSVSQ